MGCLSAMWLSKSGVSFDGQIDVCLRDLFKYCFRPPLAVGEMLGFLQFAEALHCHCKSAHWHNTISAQLPTYRHGKLRGSRGVHRNMENNKHVLNM